MFIEDKHLPTTDTRTNIAHTVVVTDMGMLVMRSGITSLRSVELCLSGLLFRTTDQSTSPGSRDHLVAIERESGQFTECATLPSVQFRTQSLRGILQYGDTITTRNIHDLVHLGRYTVKVDRNNSLRELTRLAQTVLYSLLEQYRIHIPGILLTVHKNRFGLQIRNRIGRGGKSKTLADHFITGLHIQKNQAQVKCSRSSTQSHYTTVFMQIFGQRLLKSIHVRSQRDNPVRIKGLFYKVLLTATHVSKRKPDSFVHNKLFIIISFSYVIGNQEEK